jgi:hypothetical protein
VTVTPLGNYLVTLADEPADTVEAGKEAVA